MNTESPIELRNYVQSVGITTSHVRPLAHKLANAAPPDADAPERAALGRVVTAAHAVRDAQSDHDRTTPARVRPFLLAYAGSWSGLLGALEAVASVPPEISPRGARAAKLLETFFADGVAFVKLDAFAAWSEGQRRLDRIETEKLRKELTELVGSDLLEAAIDASEKLAASLNVRPGDRKSPSAPSIRAQRIRFSKAVAWYCRILSAKVDEDDPATVERFRSAVAPIDELRITRTRLEEDDEEEEDEEVVTPAPASDPTPA